MLIAVAQAVLLQSGASGSATAPRRTHELAPAAVTAVRVDRPPAVDGRLDDPAWTLVAPITALLQRDPDEGKPASESTEVRVLYDEDALYVGARLFDSAPRLIVSRLGRRDAITHSDEFRLLLDSYHDHQTAFEFDVNPAGTKRDILRGGDGSFSDASWDPVWEAATSRDSLGWTVELRIPFSQLRFSRAQDQVWGVRVVRWIQRKNELAMFPFVAKTETGLASRFADLVGLHDIAAPKRLELVPYAVARSRYDDPTEAHNPFDDGTAYFGGAGADVKYGVSSNLTLDATINPDFGQVEIDPAFVNLTAFEQFLDEHRPFFIEGNEIFDFGGTGGGANHFSGTPLFFYSRRIGRPPQGEPTSPGQFVDMPQRTTILSAGKLSGKSATGWSVGILDAITAPERATVVDTLTGARRRDEVEPPTNYFVGRLKHAGHGGNTSVGVLATAVDRRLDAPALDFLPAAAYAGGVDLFHRWGKNTYTLAASLGGSYLRGDTLAIQQAQLSSNRYYRRPDARRFQYHPNRTALAGLTSDVYLNKVAGHWNWGLAGSTTTPGFEVNDLGFQERVDRVSAAAALGRRWTHPGRLFRQGYAFLTLAPSWNYDGDLIQRSYSAVGWAQLRNFWSLDWSASYLAAVVDDRLTRGGPIATKPAGWQGYADLYTDDRKRTSWYVFGSYARDAAGAWSLTLLPQLTLRPAAAVSLSIGPEYFGGRVAAQYVTRVSDTSAVATLGARYVFAELLEHSVDVTLRVNATFSPVLSFQLYAQPFTFSGEYRGLKELRARKTFDFNTYGRDNGSTVVRSAGAYTVDPDGPGPAAPFTVDDPDFRTRSFRTNAVVRWEYRPGSTLFVVWTHSRSGYFPYDASFDVGRDLGRELFRDRPTNVFLVKLNYWLSL